MLDAITVSLNVYLLVFKKTKLVFSYLLHLNQIIYCIFKWQ